METQTLIGALVGSALGYYHGRKLDPSLSGGTGAVAGFLGGGLVGHLLVGAGASPATKVGGLDDTPAQAAAAEFAARVSSTPTPYDDQGLEWLVSASPAQQNVVQQLASQFPGVATYYNEGSRGFVFYTEAETGRLGGRYTSESVVLAQQDLNVQKKQERAERVAARAARQTRMGATEARRGAAHTLRGTRWSERAQATAARAEAMRPGEERKILVIPAGEEPAPTRVRIAPSTVTLGPAADLIQIEPISSSGVERHRHAPRAGGVLQGW